MHKFLNIKSKNIEELFKHQLSHYKRPALDLLKGRKDIIGVEIGIMLGVNSRVILEKYDIKKLYLVDPFLYDTINEAHQNLGNDLSEIKEVVDSLLAPFRDKVVIFEDFSWNVHNKIPDNLDFVYIDGDHSYKAVMKDLELYYPKVKKGGLFSGHDYVKEEKPDLMVKSAVHDFFKKESKNSKKKIKMRVNYRDWWTIK